MPSLLSVRPKQVLKSCDTGNPRSTSKQQDFRPIVSLASHTYVTPAQDLPRASQIDTFDLSASGSSSTLSASQPKAKRPPTSPRKSKAPAKRRSVRQVDDSDEDFDAEEDVAAILDLLPEIDENEGRPSIASHDLQNSQRMEESIRGDVKEIVPNSPRVAHAAQLSRDIDASLDRARQSSENLVREDTPNIQEDTKIASKRRNSFLKESASKRSSPSIDRSVLASLESPTDNANPVLVKSPTLPRKIHGNFRQEELIARLKAEHMQLKADMTEIIEDPQRGMLCYEAKENKRRRDEIQDRLASLTSENKVDLQKQLRVLQQKILADVMLGVMPTEETKRQVQLLTEQLKVLDTHRPSSIDSSMPPTSPKRQASRPSGMLNEHNQLGPTRTFHTQAATTHRGHHNETIRTSTVPVYDSHHAYIPQVSRRTELPQQPIDTWSRQTSESNNIIELISDDEKVEYKTTTNMGHAVDFDEDDFSDGLDYVEDHDIEAQRARYAELAHQPRNSEAARSLLTPRRVAATLDAPRGPLDHYMRPSEELAVESVSSKMRLTQGAVITASPTQQVTPSRPLATQRIASTQAPPRVARPTARPVDLLSLPGMDHPWSRDVVRAMNEVFKLRYFRANQLEAINATLAGKDAFVLMPTGGGKSLCYQLPSIIHSGTTRGLTVVVSPLVSLMQDQVDHLEKLNIRATSFNSDKTVAERSSVMRQLVNDEIDCIYIAPEMLAKSSGINAIFKQLWQRQSLARIVIDEAHCVSQWGHDFRPDYKKLGDFRQDYEGVPMIALTATANDKVQIDVKNHLGLRDPACFKQSFNRPNLHYYVYPRGKGHSDKVRELVEKTHKNETGIIYCLSRAKCEALAAELGNKTAFYHAGMEKHERTNVQRLWQAGRVRVIVATIAFGMGIDKADVRFVIHTSLPKSLEGYYQETGRAGRDGRESICYLFWNFADKASLEKLIDRSEVDGQKISYAQKKVQKEAIQHVVDYADNKADCRRAQVLRFFNEPFDVKDCHETCDNCQSSEVYTDQDVTEAAKIAVKIARGVVESGDTDRDRRATLTDLVNIARGSRLARITERRWDRIDGFGALKSEPRWDITNTNKLFQHLVALEVLHDHHVPNAMGFTTTYCGPGPKANAAMGDKLSVSLKIQSPKARKKSVSNPRNKTAHQSRNVDSDDFIVDDDDDDDVDEEHFSVPEVSKAAAPRWPKDLNQYRHGSNSIVSSKSGSGTIAPPAQKLRRDRDSRADMMQKMYGRPFTPLDLDRVSRCLTELKQKRNEIQLKQGHKRADSTFSDQVLQDIAVQLPITQNELEAISEIRKDVANTHGFQLLCITNKFQEEIDSLGVIDIDAQSVVADVDTVRGGSNKSASRDASRRKKTTTPNYKEPYFREPDDDESDYFDDPEDEAPQISPHFQQHAHSHDESTSTSTSTSKAQRKTSSSKSEWSKNTKVKLSSQLKAAKASHNSKKNSSGSGIGVAKPRHF